MSLSLLTCQMVIKLLAVCQWVFDIEGDGQKKASLVAQVFSQVEGIDYNKLFSPVVRFESMHLMLALAALYITGI